MAKNYKVTKRNGEVEALDITKIRQVLQIASKDLDVNLMELESNLEFVFTKGMQTSDIHKALISTANNLTRVDAPDWRILSARLHLMSYYKEVAVNRSMQHTYGYPNFVKALKFLVKAKVYTSVLLEKYTDKELAKISRFLNTTYDNDFDYAGVNLMTKRYCISRLGVSLELPQEVFLTIAMLVEQNRSKEERLVKIRDTYEKLAKRKISLATPMLMNLRKPEGNLASCFTLPFDDDTNSIFHTFEQVGKISASGGGVGVSLAKIRSKGATIKNRAGASTGVIPNIKVLNDLMVYWNQGGARAGACTVALPTWHYDIEEFLELQTENGDLRTKAYDIFPQVICSDLFMSKVENGGDWYVIDPKEARDLIGTDLDDTNGSVFEEHYRKIENAITDGEFKLYKKVNARDIYKRIMRTQLGTGMPYVMFTDTINRFNPTPNVGPIRNVNLCVESYSSTQPSRVHTRTYADGTQHQEIETGLTHTCNLVSVNLANIDSMKELDDTCSTAVRILDNTIDITDVPTPEGKRHNELLRTIGVGVMGLADYLAKNEQSYVTQSKCDFSLVNTVFEHFAYSCTKASIGLAKARGKFKMFEGSNYSKGIILGRTLEQMNDFGALDWTCIYEDMEKYGIRNSILTAIAPNTSSSIIQGCTASILPPFSKFYVDSAENGNVPIMPPYISKKLWFYNEAQHLDQRIIVDMVSNIQKWIDTGISMELLWNLEDPNTTAKKIFDTHIAAWKQGVKAIYYTRSAESTEKKECSSCAG